MKNFLSAVYTEMSGRLKTPLLGTFALCWLLYNHDHVAKLIFSDNAQRLALIEETPFYWMSDLVIPAALSLIYIFAIPFTQWLVDSAKYALIEKRRVATHHAQLLDKYSSQTKVAKQQSRASLEYWQELHRNKAEKAGKQIIDLSSANASLSAAINQIQNELKVSEQNYEKQLKSNEELSQEKVMFSKQALHYKEELKNAVEKLKRVEQRVSKIGELLSYLERRDITSESIENYTEKVLSGVSKSFKVIAIQKEISGNKVISEVLSNEKIKINNIIKNSLNELGTLSNSQQVKLDQITTIIRDLKQNDTVDFSSFESTPSPS